MNIIDYAQDIIKSLYEHTQFATIGSCSLIIQSFPFVLLAVVIYWLIRLIWHKNKFGCKFKEVRKKCRLNEVVRLLLVFWFLELVAIIILPFGFWENIWIAMAGFGNTTIIGETLPPFAYEFAFIPSVYFVISGEQSIDSRIMLMLVGNIIAFIPFGFAFPIIIQHRTFSITLFTGASLSLIVELIQPFIYGRSGDIDDFLCNSLGTVVGYLLYLLIKKLFPRLVENGKITAKDVWLKLLNVEHVTNGEDTI